MFVIPAIDVKEGVVVKAIAGQREKYKPIKSVVCDSTKPLEVAKSLKALGFGTAYLADLDAIAGTAPNYRLYRAVSVAGLKLMVDAGTCESEEVKAMLDRGVWRVIVGTETLHSLESLKEIFELFRDSVAISADVRERVIVSKCPELRGTDVVKGLELLERLIEPEFVLLIDLARVGTGNGVDLNLVEKILREFDVKLVVGGGIRGVGDLLSLRETGAAGAIIASALHSGAVTAGELRELGFKLGAS